MQFCIELLNLNDIKNLEIQVNLYFEFVMTLVGVLSFVSNVEQINSTTMKKVRTLTIFTLMGLLSVSCGVTFVERMAFRTPDYNVIKIK